MENRKLLGAKLHDGHWLSIVPHYQPSYTELARIEDCELEKRNSKTRKKESACGDALYCGKEVISLIRRFFEASKKGRLWQANPIEIGEGMIYRVGACTRRQDPW